MRSRMTTFPPIFVISGIFFLYFTGSEFARMGLLQNASSASSLRNESKLRLISKKNQLLTYLAEDPTTYNQSDSCFANIFLCKKCEFAAELKLPALNKAK